MKTIVSILVVALLLSGSIAGIELQYETSSDKVNQETTVQNDEYELLILTPVDFYSSLIPFKEHKDQHDVPSIIVTLDDIYSGRYFTVQGRDDPEKIKYFIKDAHEAWGINYVLLVGGRHGGLFQEKWWFPVRYSYCGVSSDWERRFLSDIYFADIYDSEGEFSSWDTNNNGIFGEWTGQGAEDSPIDLKPDVYVGRWPARHVMEVEVMVSKSIAYETGTYGEDWFNKMVVIAGDTYPSDLNPLWEGNEGEEGTQRAMNWMPGFEYVKLWTSDGSFTGPDDVIAAISEGCGFLFFDGHGSPMSWATHPPSDHNTWIDGLKMNQMDLLTNNDMYPVCVVGGCHNSQFNISLLNLLKIYEGFDKWYEYVYKGETWYGCWSWLLTRQAEGGAIATLGYSALGYTKEDKNFTGEASEWLDTWFFHEYGIDDVTILGDIWGNTISAYLDTFPIDWDANIESPTGIDAKTAEEWILIGDPSLRIGGFPN